MKNSMGIRDEDLERMTDKEKEAWVNKVIEEHYNNTHPISHIKKPKKSRHKPFKHKIKHITHKHEKKNN